MDVKNVLLMVDVGVKNVLLKLVEVAIEVGNVLLKLVDVEVKNEFENDEVVLETLTL